MDAIDLFEQVALGYRTELSALQLRHREHASYDESDGAPAARVTLCDARRIEVENQVDAIMTSPPYPAVYNYLSHAREKRALLSAMAMSPSLQHIEALEHEQEQPTEAPAAATTAATPLFLAHDAPQSRDWPSEWMDGEIGSFRALLKVSIMYETLGLNLSLLCVLLLCCVFSYFTLSSLCRIPLSSKPTGRRMSSSGSQLQVQA